MKKSIIRTTVLGLSLVALFGCAPTEWTQEFTDTFMKSCNEKSDPKMAEYCSCFLTEAKKKYPNVQDYIKVSTDQKVVEEIAAPCIKALKGETTPTEEASPAESAAPTESAAPKDETKKDETKKEGTKEEKK